MIKKKGCECHDHRSSQIEEELEKGRDKLKDMKFFGENYELINFLDSGSESKVFLISSKKNRTHYALKNIRKNLSTTNEIKICSKLKQQNIINVNGCYTPLSSEDTDNVENEEVFMIMENAKYGNILNFQIKYLKKCCLSESLVCYFAEQILNGLIYLHRCKIAHMDIKPQNIVIDEFINAKIIDFSISINYQDKSLNDKIKLKLKGTNFYMPLELFKGQTIKYKDLNKIDSYGLGVTLFTLAFGYFPYDLTREDSNDLDSIYEKINNELKIKNDRNLSAYFIDFISKLLEKDINKRMSIFEAARHYWIKGAEILKKEKEKTYFAVPFLSEVITNNIKNFNDFMK